MTHSPYLEITLSAAPLERDGATVQHERRPKDKRKAHATPDALPKRARVD